MNMITIDLHCHPNLNRLIPDISRLQICGIPYNIRLTEKRHSPSATVAHIHMSRNATWMPCRLKCARVSMSLYPTEEDFAFTQSAKNFSGKKKNKHCTGSNHRLCGKLLAHQKKHYHYFEDLQAEYEYVKNQQAKS